VAGLVGLEREKEPKRHYFGKHIHFNIFSWVGPGPARRGTGSRRDKRLGATTVSTERSEGNPIEFTSRPLVRLTAAPDVVRASQAQEIIYSKPGWGMNS